MFKVVAIEGRVRNHLRTSNSTQRDTERFVRAKLVDVYRRVSVNEAARFDRGTLRLLIGAYQNEAPVLPQGGKDEVRSSGSCLFLFFNLCLFFLISF